MRFLFLCTLITGLFFSISVYAEEESVPKPFNPLIAEEGVHTADVALNLDISNSDNAINSLVNNIFKACLAYKPKFIEKESLEALCGCTAANMTEVMSAEEIQTLSADTKEGELRRKQMTTAVYIPCMEHPIKDLLQDQCLSDDAFTSGLKSPTKVCGCVADNVVEYTKSQSNLYVGRQTLQDPEKDASVQSVLVRFFNHGGFREEIKKQNRLCMYEHQMEW